MTRAPIRKHGAKLTKAKGYQDMADSFKGSVRAQAVSPAHRTAYASLTCVQARVVIVVVALCAAVGIGVSISRWKSDWLGELRSRGRGGEDYALYWAEVNRVAMGERYYDAAAIELSARGYPTLSVFNWRMPLPMWFLGKLPNPLWGKYLLRALVVAAILLSLESLLRDAQGSLRAGTCGVLLFGSFVPAVLGRCYVLPEVWSAVLMTLSLCGYGLKRPSLGVGAGLAALAFRELALPYCVMAAVLSLWKGHRREFLSWCCGFAVWAGYFGLHCAEVLPRIPADGFAHGEGWLQLGGVSFLIATIQMNGFLILLPQWIAALYLVAALLGILGWWSDFGGRIALSALAYVAAFCIVGHEFNQLWGIFAAPLYCFGVARGPACLRDLVIAARETGSEQRSLDAASRRGSATSSWRRFRRRCSAPATRDATITA